MKGVWEKTKRRKGRVRVLYSRVSWVVDPPVSRIDLWVFDPVRSRPLAEESLAGQVAATGSRSVEACLGGGKSRELSPCLPCPYFR